jgi:hypothetical protein
MTTTAELERQRDERLSMFQARYDSILEPLKRSAAPPSQGISINEYRRQSLSFIQRFLPPDSQWRNVSLDGCKADALSVIEPQILNEARLAATNPRLLAHTPAARVDPADSTLRMLELNGIRTFHPGEPGAFFGRQFTRPGRRVIGFHTSSGFVNCEGLPLDELPGHISPWLRRATPAPHSRRSGSRFFPGRRFD